MCLIIRKGDKKNFLPKVAQKDIVCYKILKFDEDGNYCTQYQECEVNVTKIFKANTNKEYDSEYMNTYWNMPFPENALEGDICKNQNYPEYHLGPGMVHAFTSLEDAEEEFYEFWDCSLWKCIIPKGTRYYTGYDNNFIPTYGAEEIKFVEQVKNI